MIHLINGIAVGWFRYIASATMQATLLALFVLGLLWICRRWSPALRYALLMLALCKFVIPPMLSFPTGLFNRIQPRQLTESVTWMHSPKASSPGILRPSGEIQRQSMQALPYSSIQIPTLTTKGKLLLLHLSGGLLILALAAWQRFRLGKLASRATEVQDPVLTETYEALLQSMKLVHKPQLLISRDNHAPITFGIWRPVVILPEALASTLPLSEIRMILGHELAHNRRRDSWIAWLQVIISVIWWFNPIYWILSRSIRAVREDCCDDMVLTSGLASRESYCRTLLRAARAALENEAEPQAAFSYIGKSQPLRRRLKRIMSAKFIRPPKLATAGMLMTFALSLILLPGVEPRILAQNAIRNKVAELGIHTVPQQITEAFQDLNKSEEVGSGSPKRKQSQPEQSGKPRKPDVRDPAQVTTQAMDYLKATQRLKAEQALRELLQRSPDGLYTYSREIAEALASEDFAVAQFYADRLNYAGATGRLKRIIDNYPDFSRIDEVNQLYETLSKAVQRPQISEYYRKWLDEDVAYIITQEERDAFKALDSDQEREAFIERFWARRNPNPGSEGNSFKAEHYRRIAYANQHFSTSRPGWKTDRGRIYIMWGMPDKIESHPSGGTWERPKSEGGGTVTTFPFERWHYRHVAGIGDDVVIEFVDLSGNGEYRMAASPDEKTRH